MSQPARRDVLKSLALGGGLTLIVGPVAHALAPRPPGQPADPATRWALLVDTRACKVDCAACVDACNREMGLKQPTDPDFDPAHDAQYIRKVTLRDPDTGHTTAPPVMCQHCAKPPCVDVCPTGASMQRADHIVQVDKHLCIGCRYCMMACPYKARSFVHQDLTDQKPHNPRGKGCVESCNLCVHRIDRGEPPACVAACQRDGGGAMVFGDLADPNSDLNRRLAEAGGHRIRADLGLDTGVYYQGL
ncbi:sulfate reduction electron transfer complex DsrMKJOP subunit DsrO [Roseospirillum parvum]|uniref:Prokaryotic molybdopterin-containing oxidoreductase family, iron-sulfur binding subunit n=1 Tax=Roseospirillum parvum TaxID=83401 RepID=A0A1G7W1U8_9PROT|nr:4Fe-4S dicluster domain-containing protein [Roseospirillum parvum]SDG65848.1 prokaryotic molybdopterin-containing oxidoreductase family, iron-sulfur binding subunit [Roseospirillum parvum]